jgi:hypothetical protein
MNKSNYKYIEIKKFSNDEITSRIDVSNKSERLLEKTEKGVNINLNHEEYYTDINYSDSKLDTF